MQSFRIDYIKKRDGSRELRKRVPLKLQRPTVQGKEKSIEIPPRHDALHCENPDDFQVWASKGAVTDEGIA